MNSWPSLHTYFFWVVVTYQTFLCYVSVKLVTQCGNMHVSRKLIGGGFCSITWYDLMFAATVLGNTVCTGYKGQCTVARLNIMQIQQNIVLFNIKKLHTTQMFQEFKYWNCSSSSWPFKWALTTSCNVPDLSSGVLDLSAVVPAMYFLCWSWPFHNCSWPFCLCSRPFFCCFLQFVQVLPDLTNVVRDLSFVVPASQLLFQPFFCLC